MAAWKFHYLMKNEKSNANEANCSQRTHAGALSNIECQIINWS